MSKDVRSAVMKSMASSSQTKEEGLKQKSRVKTVHQKKKKKIPTVTLLYIEALHK